jgi:tetratricopeptide (TPR) repeat protein
LLREKKDFTAGLALVTKLADGEFKDNGPSLAGLAAAVVSIEDENKGKGDLDLALRLAKRAAELNGSDDLWSQRLLGQVYAAKGDYAKAVECETKVVEGLNGPMRAREQKLLDEYKAKLAPAKDKS